jgi:hypothetical protein
MIWTVKDLSQETLAEREDSVHLYSHANFVYLFTKQAALIWRSIVQSLPLQLVFPVPTVIKRVITNVLVSLKPLYQLPPAMMSRDRDYSRHIAENIAKGSSLCPFGSLTMGQMALPEEASSEDALADRKFDLHGFNADAPDSDDEPLSDLEWFAGFYRSSQ